MAGADLSGRSGEGRMQAKGRRLLLWPNAWSFIQLLRAFEFGSDTKRISAPRGFGATSLNPHKTMDRFDELFEMRRRAMDGDQAARFNLKTRTGIDWTEVVMHDENWLLLQVLNRAGDEAKDPKLVERHRALNAWGGNAS